LTIGATSRPGGGAVRKRRTALSAGRAPIRANG
jgi:hypothetical protein